MKGRVWSLLLAALVVCCPQISAALEIALIGDDARKAVFQQLTRELGGAVTVSGPLQKLRTADGKHSFTVMTRNDAAGIANQALTADVALLVVDAMQGPLPSVREHILVARQAGVPTLACYFANTRALVAKAPTDAAELLELEDMEMRELLSVYKMGGDGTIGLYDSNINSLYKSPHGDGTPGLQRFLGGSLPKRVPLRNLAPVTEFAGTFYLLTDPETNGRGKAVPVSHGTRLDVWMAGELRPASVKTNSNHKPGDAPEFTLLLDKQSAGAEGLRLLLVKGGVVVGLGVVSRVLR